MTSQSDCWFFYNSNCTKGDDCPYRHEPLATGKPVCDLWKSGSCKRNPCRFRHVNVESAAHCYYESQPSGCLNSSCQFSHSKPRPLLTNFNPVQPMSKPPFNVPFQSRFPPNSIFGNAYTNTSITPSPRYTLQTSVRNQPPFYPSGGPRPGMFPFPNIRPSLFNQNNTSLGITNLSSISQQNLFRLPSLMKGSLQTNNSGPMSPTSDMIRPNTGDGLLPLPVPRSPFPFGDLFPFNMISPGQVLNKQKNRSSAKNSYKRTVKKYEGIRYRKSESKRRNERKTSQDPNIEKKKKKEKRNKPQKDNSSKVRKVKQERGVLNSKRSGGDTGQATGVPTLEAKDRNADDEEDTYEEINLGFKVKTLEEILRDKALKKLLERQNMKSGAEVSNSEGEIQPRVKSKTTGSESIDEKSIYMVYSIEEVLQNVETSTVETVKPKFKKLKPLKPLKPLTPLRNTKRKSLDAKNMTDKAEEKKDGDQKNPLPPLKRLKPLSKTSQKGNSTAKVLKRKLNTDSDDVQIVPGKKLKKIERVLVEDNSFSEDAGNQVPANKVIADKSVVSCVDFETSSTKEITPVSLAKSTRKPKRTIVMLHSGTHKNAVKIRPGQVDKIQGLRKEGKSTLSELAEQDIAKEDQKREIDEQVKEMNLTHDKDEPQKIVSTVKVLPKKRVLNGNRKPPGKIIMLSTSKDTKRSMLHNDSQCKTNNAVINKDTRPSSSSVISGTNAVVENMDKQGVNKDVDQTLKQDEHIKTNDGNTVVQLSTKPSRMIKLNRDRLTEKKNDKGTSRILLSTLGRKLKVNKAKPLSQKQAVVKPVSVHNTEFSEQGQGSSASAEAPQDSNMREKSEVKFADTSQTIVPSFALANLSTNSETKFRLNDKIGNTDQKRLEAATVTTATRPTATTATDMSKTFAKNDSDNDNTNHDQIVEELNEEEDKRIALTTTKNSTPQPTIEDAADSYVPSRRIDEGKRVPEPEHHKIDKISPEERRGNSLDKFFDEVSEDVEDEGEDFLNEALAELSPVNTDDEEDVSNADDLLLEIEEMINS